MLKRKARQRQSQSPTSTQKMSSLVSMAASSSYSPPQWMYDVFLSYRGTDTRKNFTCPLYSYLVQGGIRVYKDDRDIERGKPMETAYLQGIEESRFSIVVFSRNYASSPYCLAELVKIVQCMKDMGHTALPLFYDVDSSEVANQTGDYKKAFIEHKEKFSENPDMVQTWSDCLSTVANLSGWVVRNRDETQLIKRILEWIQCKLSSSSYPPPQWMYDVFLSFSGKDTRNNFTGHLYYYLVQGGINVYMHDRELERGKTVEPALLQAIEESRFSIVVFSRNYASSPWCLAELVKIVQCMKEMGHTALPLFYDVDPSEVANQTGDYKKAFIEHKEKFSKNPDKVQTWSDCLSTVANLSGWVVRNRDESQSIKMILEWIQCKLLKNEESKCN